MQYLLSTLAPVLTGRYGVLLGRELFRAAGESVLAVAGHTADTPRHGLTRRYHVLALNLAHQAGDRDLGGAVLVSLAEHLLACGEVDPAADVLGGVRQGANPSAAWHAAARLGALAAARASAELATEAAAGLTSTAVADAVAALPRQGPQD